MNPSSVLASFFSLLSLVGSALLGLKLLKSDLYHKYPVFFAYCFFRAVYLSFILMLRDFRSPFYQKFWMATEPLIWIFYVLLVLELYGLVLQNHKGLYTFGRWAMYGSLAISLIVSAVSLLPGWTAARAGRSLMLGYYLAIERGIVFSLLLFLLIALFVLSRYPVPLSRNVVLHTLTYSTLFLSNTFGLFVHSVLGWTVSYSIGIALTGVSSACILVWLLFFDASGETVPLTLPRMGPDEEERVLAQLQALNTTLLRVSRK